MDETCLGMQLTSRYDAEDDDGKEKKGAEEAERVILGEVGNGS